jgi:DNA-binding NarL/FixJ family response regulator
MAGEGRLTAVLVDHDPDTIDQLNRLASARPDVEVVGATTAEPEVLGLLSTHRPDVLVVGRWVRPDPRSARRSSTVALSLVSGLTIASKARYTHPETAIVVCAPGHGLQAAAQNVGAVVYVDSRQIETLWSQVIETLGSP